jgi:phosphate transport system protein
MITTPHEHIVKSYDSELQRLYGEIARMGEIAVAQLDAAVDALGRRDSKAAQRVVDNDIAIDTLEQEVSQDVLRLLALRQPMARDLREVYGALRISADIERIGDYAANVAKRAIPLSMVAPVRPAAGLEHLATLAAVGVRDVLAAYQDRDAERAYAVWKNDTVLDEAYTGYFRQLLTYMMEDPRNITPCTHLLFMAKNIERIGDHATNIAENVWFQVTGEPLQVPRRKLDETASADFSGLAVKPDKP